MLKKAKKIIIYIIFSIILLNLFKIAFIPKVINTNSFEDLIEKIDYKEFNYGDYKTVKLLHTDTRTS